MKKHILTSIALGLLFVSQIKTTKVDIKNIEMERDRVRKLTLKKVKHTLELGIKSINKELKQVRNSLNAINTGKLAAIRIAILPEEIAQLKIEEWKEKRDRFKKEGKYPKLIPKIAKIIEGLKKKIEIIRLNREWDKLLTAADNEKDEKKAQELINKAYKNELEVKKLKDDIKKSDAYLHVWALGEDWIVHTTITPKRKAEIRKVREKLRQQGLENLKKMKSELEKKEKSLKKERAQITKQLYMLTFEKEKVRIEVKLPEEAVLADIEEWKEKRDRFKKEGKYPKLIPKIAKIIEGLKKKIQIIRLSREQDEMLDAAELEEDKKKLKKLLNERYEKELEVKRLKDDIKKSGVYLHVWGIGGDRFYM